VTRVKHRAALPGTPRVSTGAASTRDDIVLQEAA